MFVIKKNFPMKLVVFLTEMCILRYTRQEIINGRYPSGQRKPTVNRLFRLREVRILPCQFGMIAMSHEFSFYSLL